MRTSRKAKSETAPTVAVIGYGSQGRSVAQNLCDSGYNVIIGLRSGSKTAAEVRNDGAGKVATIPKAVRAADAICFAFPDHLHSRVYGRSIGPSLKNGQTLWFLHATSVHFGQVKPPNAVDTILIAPHAPGEAVRREYLDDQSISGFFAVHHDHSGEAAKTAIRLAKAIGIRRTNLLKTTFEKEAVGDLFGEQAVLCGGLAMLIKAGFETLTERGWKPDHAYLEVAYQLDLIIALIKQHGIEGMFDRISVAARYGSLITGPDVIGRDSHTAMRVAFEKISSGEFAAELANIDETSLPKLKKALGRLTDQRLEEAIKRFSK